MGSARSGHRGVSSARSGRSARTHLSERLRLRLLLMPSPRLTFPAAALASSPATAGDLRQCSSLRLSLLQSRRGREVPASSCRGEAGLEASKELEGEMSTACGGFLAGGFLAEVEASWPSPRRIADVDCKRTRSWTWLPLPLA